MIRLSNHHSFEYMAASGALAFDGNGWPWEQPLRWVKLLDPKRFTIVLKTVTYGRRKGNLRRFRLFRTVRFLDEKGNSDFRTWWHPEGTVNAVGLTNPGIKYWCQKIAPQVEKSGYHVIASIASDDIAELQEMAQMLDGRYGLKGLEINASCPNTESELLENAGHVIDAVWAVAEILRMPLILKLSTTHDYLKIERETRGLIRAISINSVPWNIVFPQKKSPLENLGGGGVSGKLAQPHTWKMLKELAKEGETPVIAPGIWNFGDIQKVRDLGASAVSFGSIFIRYPWRPTLYVRKDMRRTKK